MNFVCEECFMHDFLTHTSWWFDASPEDDAYISEKYIHILDTDLEDRNSDIISRIMVYDQIPRHVFRNSQSSHIISYFLQKALKLFESLHVDDIINLPVEKWCFAMLPYRHSQDPSKIQYVMKCAWQKLYICHGEDKELVKRFIKATFTRCPTDDQSMFIDTFRMLSESKTRVCIQSEFDDIIDQTSYIKCDNKDIYNAFKALPDTSYIISLSGGVDSMVCSWVMKKTLQYPMTAVHINYCNRNTAFKEEEFVTAWCTYLGIPLIVRRINEINRKQCMENDMRDIYERYTRNVRYATYKTVVKRHERPRVVLGHNKDDCFENIMTNIAHQNKYDNLHGMSQEIYQDDITFIRPLLNISKESIREFAAYNNIPHLPNSTPLWSQRGQIRTNIVPVLDAWDTRMIPGLFNISSIMQQMHGYFTMYVRNIVHEIKKNGHIHIQIHDIQLSPIFWKEIIKLTQSIIPSEKAVKNIINRLASLKSTFDRIKIHQTSYIEVHKSVRISLQKTDKDSIILGIHNKS